MAIEATDTPLAAETCPPADGVAKLYRGAPAANTAITITLAANPEKAHKLRYFHAYYSGAPSAQVLTVAVGGVTVYSEPMGTTSLAPRFRSWACGLYGSRNAAMLITLPAGGVGVSGVLAAEIE